MPCSETDQSRGIAEENRCKEASPIKTATVEKEKNPHSIPKAIAANQKGNTSQNSKNTVDEEWKQYADEETPKGSKVVFWQHFKSKKNKEIAFNSYKSEVRPIYIKQGISNPAKSLIDYIDENITSDLTV